MHLKTLCLLSFLPFCIISATEGVMNAEESKRMADLEAELVKMEQKMWGLEVRIMHVERLLFNNHPVGMTPGNGNNSLIPLRSPGAIVRRNETLRRRGMGRAESSQSDQRRQTPDTEGDSYFNITPH